MRTLDVPHRTPTLSAYDSHLLGGAGLPLAESARADRQTLVNGVFDHYEVSLACESRVLRHLMKMCLANRQLLERQSVGFSNRTLGLRLPSVGTSERDQVRGALENLDLLIASGGEFFRGALVFPLKNDQGDVVEAYGQRLTPRLRQGTPYQAYWSLKSGRFFNHDALSCAEEIVLCENPFQAFCLLCHGVSGAVAPVGRWGFNDGQLDALERARPNRVVLAWENSADAQRAARLVCQAISAIDVPVWHYALNEPSVSRMPPPPITAEVANRILMEAVPIGPEASTVWGGLWQ